MQNGWKAFFCFVVVAFAAAPAHAGIITYIGSFSGFAENPSNASPGVGTAVITLDDVTRVLTVNLTWSGLLSPTTVAHIHCCAPTPQDNRGVATQTPSFTGFPAGVTSGSYSNSFDLNLASSWNATFVTNNGGLNGAFTVFLAGLNAGQAYANIHSQQFTGGELRANLVQTPLPAAALLFAAGGGMLAGMKRRKPAPIRPLR